MRFATPTAAYYCGIDLHARTMYLVVLDQDGCVRLNRNYPARPDDFLAAVVPFRDDLVVASIPGVGTVTAAILPAFILAIERFETPNKLVAYFGVLPPRGGARLGAHVWTGTRSSRRNREEEPLRTVAGVTSPNPASRRGRPPCAPPTLEQPFLTAVITETGLDIHRYICSG